ncbi:sensor histidine kinase [Algoriphagus sp. AK58]|uniref:sensor histidine kinase n=1 Tax=Algoriphagus sp. AK58 TaxID=1406877 RepID=UPI00164EF0BF|nr:sensor histidine kinase [Algoriphagus sp. AK58]MBC6365434.1 histidine kinase [Algoriphagus sp. AK58]
MTQTTTDCKDQKGLWRDFRKFLLINLAIALILQVIFCPACFLSWDDLIGLFPEFIFSFCVSMALSYGGSRVEEFWDPRLSWIHHPVKRLIATIVTYLAYSCVASFVIVFLYAWIDGQFTLDQIPWKAILDFTLIPMQIALVFMAIFTSRSWLLEWRKSAIEAEQLRSEKLASQYQSLKDQLNPHFLFNSLNALSNLVYEDADRSAAFIQKLSKIYRYVLDVQQEELVELDLELEFARNFLDLQKIRFEENLNFRVDVPNCKGCFLPPLSLQLLLENAIKHNIASQENPLFISIIQKGDELWVSNTFQPKTSQNEPSTGVGLENIRSRYRILSDRTPEIYQSEHEFLVKLPLLKVNA